MAIHCSWLKGVSAAEYFAEEILFNNKKGFRYSSVSCPAPSHINDPFG